MEYTDTELLDFLQKLTDESDYSGQVVCRDSTTGRGWRLHEIDDRFDVGNPNVREAIAAYMESKVG